MTMHTIRFLCLCLATAMTASDARAQATPRVRGAFFAMTVSSMDSTIAWYQDKLGLQVLRRESIGDVDQAHLATAWMEVELFMPRNSRPGSRAATGGGVEKVGVFIDRATYVAMLARLREHNAKFIGREITESDGSRFFMVEDNNGLAIQIFMVP